jgi:hypothetical protein
MASNFETLSSTDRTEKKKDKGEEVYFGSCFQSTVFWSCFSGPVAHSTAWKDHVAEAYSLHSSQEAKKKKGKGLVF